MFCFNFKPNGSKVYENEITLSLIQYNDLCKAKAVGIINTLLEVCFKTEELLDVNLTPKQIAEKLMQNQKMQTLKGTFYIYHITLSTKYILLG